eukprot:m.127364 g.127364  ORF g.127364 m.127364 type:complete len:114 (-) comp15655_c5_seq1:915-1256(-)
MVGENTTTEWASVHVSLFLFVLLGLMRLAIEGGGSKEETIQLKAKFIHSVLSLFSPLYKPWLSRRRRMEARTVAAAAVPKLYAPPATVFLQCLQLQMPTALRFTDVFPQKEQM